MLVLSRKTDEALCFTGGITVTILGIQGNRVKVGVEAPMDITVTRKELMPIVQRPPTPPVVHVHKPLANDCEIQT